jgi:hypothetical protein
MINIFQARSFQPWVVLGLVVPGSVVPGSVGVPKKFKMCIKTKLGLTQLVLIRTTFFPTEFTHTWNENFIIVIIYQNHHRHITKNFGQTVKEL